MSDEPGGAGDQQHELLSRLRALVEAKDAEIAVLRAELEASLERERRLELRLAALERRLSMDSSDSGTPSSRERIGAKEARRARQQSERDRRADRKRGGQPGHKGKGLARDPDPGERKEAPPRRRKAVSAGPAWTALRLRGKTSGRRSSTRRSSLPRLRRRARRHRHRRHLRRARRETLATATARDVRPFRCSQNCAGDGGRTDGSPVAGDDATAVIACAETRACDMHV
jgi:hypothetical protein